MDPLAQLMQKASMDANLQKSQPLYTLEKAKDEKTSERTTPSAPLRYLDSHALSREMEFSMERSHFRSKLGTALWERLVGGTRPKFSSTPLGELKTIYLKEMNIGQYHKGRFLLCRTTLPPSGGHCVSLGVEDPEGWSQLLSIENFPGAFRAGRKELDTLFPLNTVLAIREPTTETAFAGGGTHIKIESPSDIVFIDVDDPIQAEVVWSNGHQPSRITTLSPAEWKSIGDGHFKDKKFFPATVAYSYALGQDPSLVAARLNRCLANNRLSNFTANLHDAQIVSETNTVESPDRIKAFYRAALAEYGLGKYHDAEKYYKKCLSVDTSLKDASLGIKKCRARIQEQKEGIYDWKQLLVQSETPCFRPDVADYIGPIKVVPMENIGGGRGVIATAPIKAGDLLIVSKPVSMEFPEENDGSLLQQTITKITTNHGLYEQVLDLYAGSNFEGSKPAVISEIKNDTCPISPIKFPRDIDIGRIESIISLNSFALRRSSWMVDFEEVPLSGDTKFPTGLFIYPALINHTCLGNAQRATFGHLMVIRAVQDIAIGDEILISYCALDSPYSERTKVLPKYLGDCDCSLCLSDRAAGPQFHDALDKINKQLTSRSAPLDSLRRLVQTLDSLYPQSYPKYRLESCIAHRRLADRLQTIVFDPSNSIPYDRLFPESIRHEMLSLEALGIQVTDKEIQEIRTSKRREIGLPISVDRVPYNSRTACMTCLMMVGKFLSLKAEWRAEMWFRAALWLEDKRLGGGIPLFRVRYSQIIKELGSPFEALLSKIEKA